MCGQETTEAETETTKAVEAAEQEMTQCCDDTEQYTDWYQRNALRTESYDMEKILERLVGPDAAAVVIKSMVAIEPETIRLLHAAMGLETEVGEFMDPLKKYLFYGKPYEVLRNSM